jgi:hypothetical protein
MPDTHLDGMQVIGEQNHRVDGERPFQQTTAEDASQERTCRNFRQKTSTAVGNDREEKRSTWNICTSPIRHGRIIPHSNRPGHPALIGLGRLRSLNLNNTKVIDLEAVEHIVRIPSLTDLGMSSTRISEWGLKQIVSIPNIRKLDLSLTELTPHALAQL